MERKGQARVGASEAGPTLARLEITKNLPSLHTGKPHHDQVGYALKKLIITKLLPYILFFLFIYFFYYYFIVTEQTAQLICSGKKAIIK